MPPLSGLAGFSLCGVSFHPSPFASSTGAEMVSRHCQDAGDWEGAIEFLLMAKRTADAFSLAKSHAQMDTFTKVAAAACLLACRVFVCSLVLEIVLFWFWIR